MRKIRSGVLIAFESFDAFLYKLQSSVRPTPAYWLKRLVLCLVVRNEEMLNLFDHLWPKIFKSLYIRMCMRPGRHREQAIIAGSLAV